MVGDLLVWITSSQPFNYYTIEIRLLKSKIGGGDSN